MVILGYGELTEEYRTGIFRLDFLDFEIGLLPKLERFRP
jgi:hypothetical protein